MPLMLTGGNGLCRAVYRPGRHVANYVIRYPFSVTGVLTGIYMLLSGAIANYYLAGVIKRPQTLAKRLRRQRRG